MPSHIFKRTTRIVVALVLSTSINAMARQAITKSSAEDISGESVADGAASPIPFHLARGVPVVQVILNGHGPYNFLVDTGTNVTLVERPVLDQLFVSMQNTVPLRSTTGDGAASATILETVAVGGLKLHRMEVGVLKRGQLTLYGSEVLGVLGEDFLKNFDLLLDYQHGVLVLDMSSVLAASMMGEHVAFERSGLSPGGVVPDRILVQSKLRAFKGDPLACLVDSGTHQTVIFLRDRLVSDTQSPRAPISLGSPLGGNSDCLVEPSRVEVGSERVRSTDIVACQGKRQADADFDCLLPTNLFRSVFISHRGGYIVLNPQAVKQQARITP